MLYIFGFIQVLLKPSGFILQCRCAWTWLYSSTNLDYIHSFENGKKAFAVSENTFLSSAVPIQGQTDFKNSQIMKGELLGRQSSNCERRAIREPKFPQGTCK